MTNPYDIIAKLEEEVKMLRISDAQAVSQMTLGEFFNWPNDIKGNHGRFDSEARRFAHVLNKMITGRKLPAGHINQKTPWSFPYHMAAS